MHVTPTGNVRITCEDLAEKPEKCTSLNAQKDFMYSYILVWGKRWLSWFGHCATSRKVAVSIPDDVGNFH